jgi:glycosyltransferase involved in cell wall biosynthesis
LSRSVSTSSESLPAPEPPPRSAPLRIVFYEPAGRGGICHYTWELAEHLALAGHRVTVWTTEGYELGHFPRHFRVRPLFSASRLGRLLRVFSGRESDERLRPGSGDGVSRASRSRLRAIRLRLLHGKALAWLLVSRPDVVHFQWLADADRDRAFMRALRALGVPVVLTAHDVLSLERDSEAERAARGRLYRAADRVVAHSETDRQRLVEIYGLGRDAAAVVPHGAYDFRFGRPGTIGRDEARQQLGIPIGRKVLLFFGLIKRYKGLKYLLSAFDRIERSRDDTMLWIVGDIARGDAEDFRSESDRLARLAGRERVRTRIGYVPVEDIPTYFAAADLVVLPYSETSQSGVLLSAYGAGKPVVVTDVGSLAETVEEGKTGVVVPARDPEAIARAALGLLADPARLEEMGQRARQLAQSSYSWYAVARRTVEVYRETAERSGRLRASARGRLHGKELGASPRG